MSAVHVNAAPCGVDQQQQQQAVAGCKAATTPPAPMAGAAPANEKCAAGSAPSAEATDDVKVTRQHIKNLEAELTHARDTISALRADRKRLKAEKLDVLNQMKQLFATIEDKEKELRDFIRAYEKRMRESETALRQMAHERNEAEREKWTILRHARDEAERSAQLAAQLAAKEARIDQLHDEIGQLQQRAQQQQQQQHRGAIYSRASPTAAAAAAAANSSAVTVGGSSSTSSRLNTTNTSGCGPSSIGTTSGGQWSSSHRQRSSISSMDSAAIVSDPGDEPLYSRIDHSSSTNDSHHHHYHHQQQQQQQPKSLPPLPSAQQDGTALATALVNQLMADVDSLSAHSIVPGSLLSTPVGQDEKRPQDQQPHSEVVWKRSTDELSVTSAGSRTLSKPTRSALASGPWGSISRVFSRAVKQRKTLDLSIYEGADQSRRSWSPSSCTTPISEETVGERFRHWEEAERLPLAHWKAGHVLAWMEFGLGMGRYLAACAENVKSGKVLLELSDAELDAALGLRHAMHRKKIRLAIEERRPGSTTVRYPLAGATPGAWVPNEWLAEIGLAQYADAFGACLMDGRMLDNLTKRELEKHLGVTRKAHQTSIVHGITFLRMMKYDRAAIGDRRRQCESADCDPIAWTNERFIAWARAIDLAEYADNLRGSGIHGALVVLDPGFNADVMASAMSIPTSKNIIRRHLATELDALTQVARARYEQRARQARAERKRTEKLDAAPPPSAGGRSLSRSFTTGLSLSGSHQDDLYAFKGSADGSSQTNGFKSSVKTSLHASLSRAFGRMIKQERLSAAAAAAANNNLPTKDHEANQSDWSLKTAADRRTKNGDIDNSLTVTRV